MKKEKMFIVGQYIELFNALTGQQLPCGPIFQSCGLRIHIEKRHPDAVNNIKLIPDIIESPDYIGHSAKEKNSIEFVKVFKPNVMVCINLYKDGRFKKVHLCGERF